MSMLQLARERRKREAAVFEALAAVYALPHRPSASASAFIAGQVCSHLADVARLSDDRDAAAAGLAALREIQAVTADLLEALAAPEAEAQAGFSGRASDAAG